MKEPLQETDAAEVLEIHQAVASTAAASSSVASTDPASTDPASPSARPRLAQRITSAISVTSFASILSLGLSSLAGIAVARNGGPNGYAVFVAANMLIYVTATLCQWGFPWAVAKYIAAEEEHGRHLAVQRACAASLLWMLGLGLASGLVLAVGLPVFQRIFQIQFEPGFAFLLPLAMLGAMASDCADGIYFGLLRPQRNLWITSCGPLAMLAYVIVRRTGWDGPIWGAVVVSYVCSGLLALWFLWRDQLYARPLNRQEMRPIFKDLLPSANFTFFSVFGVWIDRWAVGSQLGGSHLGLYSAAVSLMQVALRLPTNLSYLLLPAAMKMGQQNGETPVSSAEPSSNAPETPDVSQKVYEQQQRLLLSAVSAFGYCSTAMLVMMLLGASSLLLLLFGPGFLPARDPVLLMSPALLASAVSLPAMMILKSSSHNHLMTPLLGITLAIRVVLLFWFTRMFDLSGTALATSLAEMFQALACIWMLRRSGTPFPLQPLLAPLAVGALSFGIGWAVRQVASPWIAMIAAAIVFLPAFQQLVRRLRAASA